MIATEAGCNGAALPKVEDTVALSPWWLVKMGLLFRPIFAIPTEGEE
jgi:hypothetical protein